MKFLALIFAFLCISSLCGPVQASTPNGSEINSAYTLLRQKIDQSFANASSDASSGPARVQIADYYFRFIHKYQQESNIKSISASDLDLLRRAAIEAYVDTNNRKILDDFLIDIRELDRRGIASERAYQDEVYAFVQARMFENAQGIVAAHPKAVLPPIPKVSITNGFNPDAPAILSWNKDANKFVAQNVNLKDYKLIIVGHPLCHFTQRAVVDISEDDKLMSVTQGALWILPQDGNLDPSIISDWNTHHPNQIMSVVYLAAKWPGFNNWGTPTFYFLKDGKVDRSIVGWPSGGNAKALLSARGIR